jgi:GCN5-related N-acetyl-transferase
MTADGQQHTPRALDEALVSVRDNARASRFELRVNEVLKLIRFALDEARAAGRNVLPFCPFVRSFIQQHPAYVDLVGRPQRFGITVHTPHSG